MFKNSMYNLLFGLVLFSATVSAPTLARSDNLSGVINLFGHIAEQSIREQEQRRQRAYQSQQNRARENAYRDRARAAERREGARRREEFNAQREAEIVLVKRVQTALSKLGYYTSRIDGDRGPGTRGAEAAYRAAFGVQSFDLDEHDVQQLERFASTGFATRTELDRAAAGGFVNRADLLAAEAGGFENAAEYADATRMGFKTAVVYREYQQSGFTDTGEFARAKRGGFVDLEEFQDAQNSGFDQRDEYQEFRASGKPDREAFLVAKTQDVERKTASTACFNESDGPDSFLPRIDACLKAIRLGAREGAFRKVYATFGERVSAERERIVSEGAITEIASLGMPIQNSTAAESENNRSDASIFLQRKSEIELVLRAHACGWSVLSDDHEQATIDCKLESNRLDQDVVAALHATAAKEAAIARRAAEAEAERQRNEAVAERKRLALAAAREHADLQLEDVGAFTKDKRTLNAAIDIARAVVALKEARKGNDVTRLEQANTRLTDLLAKEGDYQLFLGEKKAAAEIASVNARTTAIAETDRLESFIREYVSQNILSDHVDDLLTLQSELANAKSSQDLDQITNAQKKGRQKIDDYGLGVEFAAFIVPSQQTEPSLDQAANGLVVTSLNEKLLSGDARDLVILGNYTATAPHLVLDLLGRTVFDRRQAALCWYGISESETESGREALRQITEMGVDQTYEQSACQSAELAQADVILLRRGAFLTSDVLEARHVVTAFERSDLRLLSTIAWTDVGDIAQKNADEAAAIEIAVKTGGRDGYGLVSFSNDANRICLVAPEGNARATEAVLRASFDRLKGFVNADAAVDIQPLDQAFYGIQRQECSAVYADHGNLKTLIEGLTRAQLSYAFLPFWIEPEQVAAAAKAIEDEEQDLSKQTALNAQQAEARARLDAEKYSEQDAVRQRREASMRQRYGEEAKASFNHIDEIGRSFFAFPIDGSSDGQRSLFVSLFPKIATWKSDRDNDKWEIDHTDSDMFDYGTAEWQGRRAEVVFARFDVESKNRQLGRYADDCFVIGYIIDAEFSMVRDAFEGRCQNAETEVAAWKSGRSYESRWIAALQND